MKCSTENVKIEDGDIKYYFNYLDWDTRYFNIPSYFLDSKISVVAKSPKIERQFGLHLNNSFISTKIDTSFDLSIIHILQDYGFYYIETEISLEFNKLIKSCSIPANTRIERLDNTSNVPYDELGAIFSLTRFHSDPKISNHVADGVWISYLKNFIPTEKNHLFAAFVGDELAGVILTKRKSDQVDFFWVGFLKKFQHKGIGSFLIQRVLESYKGFRVVTGTQAKNIGALNFYLKNGFKINQTKIVMHRWR